MTNRKMKRQMLMVVMVVAMVAAAVPLFGMRAGASSNATASKGAASAGLVGPAAPLTTGASKEQQQVQTQSVQSGNDGSGARADGAQGERGPRLSREVVSSLGWPTGPVDSVAAGKKGAQAIEQQLKSHVTPQAGEPVNMSAAAAFSAGLITTEGGRNTQFDEVLLLGDWDGREDCVADHSGKVDDFSGKVPTSPTGPNEFTLTRAAISEHTIANGFAEDIFYYGDSFGNVYVAATTNLTLATPTPNVFTINLPTVLNAFGTLASDDQVTITGITINPVADLGSFARVNGSFASFNGLTGEIMYVAFEDTESGFRLLANGTLIRSGILAFPVADIVSAASAPPGIVSPTGYPVQVGGAFGVAFSVFDNVAGVSSDDDGSIYFQQVDLIQFTGGNITKIASTDQPGIPGVQVGFQDRSLATNGFFTISTLNPTNGAYGTASGPANQVSTATNYSGTSNLFGNIAALACGPCNTVYAAVARSGEPGDDVNTQNTEAFFSTAGTALGATPSMIIRFADVVGAFAPCTVPQNPVTGAFVPGAIGLPIGDGFADPAAPGIPLRVPPASVATLTPGVNNFRVFVLGNGPDIRGTSASAAIGATPGNTQRINDGVGFQVDYTAHSGIAVSEEGTVYVVSGGTPAGLGKNPSPTFGEILCFPDSCPADGRADFIDLRGASTLPNPPSDANVGDGLSTRTDHIFWQAPLDQVTVTPTGIAGLNRGFLLYTNRLRTADKTPGLPNGGVQGDDTSNGPIIWEQFDPSHQVAGGDDQVSPFTGDDDDGAGSPVTPGPLSGGFEFLFANLLGDFTTVGAACGTGNGVWNGFFLNSNGNITFSGGDTSNIASVPAFRAGLPKIAAAWCDLNPGSRAGGFLNTFPLQALGFANINDFAIRNINVPEFGHESCNSSNTFATFLFDDGTGVDENANQPLNPANPIGNNAVPFDLLEGPTANHFVKEPNTGVIVGCPPRQDGTGHFCLQFCRMDLLGTPDDPVLVGFSVGNQNALNPPGLCSTNLSAAARTADTDPFRPCLIGEGTEPEIFEFFNTGSGPSIGSGGEITFADPDFDLRFEGNDPGIAASINTRQTDLNRGEVCFFGTTCQLPPNPVCLIVLPTAPVVVPPGDPAVGTAAAATPNGSGQKIASPTAGIVNALCNVQLNVVGCGFIPNETTIICQGFADATGVPLQRAGKTVTSAIVVACDTNGDGVPDLGIPLTGVTPISANLVQGTLSTLGPQLPGTAFPLACCGGFASLTVTTTFTAGNNNIFNLLAAGGFTRQTSCTIDLGPRAPVVISASPSGTFDCANPQDLLITGSCFILPNGTLNVTSVFAVDAANPSVVIQAQRFAVLSPTLIDALFNFGSGNAGHTFFIFVSGPNGTSRNLSAPSGTCPAGNEQGIQVTVKCTASTPVTPPKTNQAVVTGCSLDRAPSGKFVLTVSGSNFQAGLTIVVNQIVPPRMKLTGLQPDNSFNTIVLKGGLCVQGGLPGTIVVTNPGAAPSAGFSCTAQCPSN